MQVFIKLLLILVLLIIIYQDFRHRQIHFLTVLSTFILAIGHALLSRTIMDIATDLGIVVCFLLSQYLFVQIYFKLRKGHWIQVDREIGQGDVYFLFALIPLFSASNYVIFYVLSLIFSVLLFLMLIFLGKLKNKTIPLAGYQSIFTIFLLILDTFHPIVFYNDLIRVFL